MINNLENDHLRVRTKVTNFEFPNLLIWLFSSWPGRSIYRIDCDVRGRREQHWLQWNFEQL